MTTPINFTVLAGHSAPTTANDTPVKSNAVSFTVLGLPVPQGSMRAYQNRLISNNDKALKSWRHDVATAALQHRPDNWNIKDPVELHCEFVFPRPLGHFGTGKNSDKLKASAPTHHTKTPDADKLTRGIGDAISVTKVLLHDDSQIVHINTHKRYADLNEPTHAQITVIPLVA